MLVHVDSSAVAAVVLDEPDPVRFWDLADRVYASDLVAVEVRRVVHRLRLNHQFTDEESAAALVALVDLERRLTFVEVSRQMLRRAGESFPTHIRTLDAIHLATVLLNSDEIGDRDVTFVTRDRRLATAAQALAMRIVGV